MVYLDNSATTAPCEKAISEINSALHENFGNPSSLHILGMNAELKINEVRKKLADLLECRPDEIYFVSCATEGNNTCIEGAVRRNKRIGKKIVTTAIEHPSVLNTVKRFESEGFEAEFVSPESDGTVSAEKFAAAIDEKTVLASMMLVNNETGAVMPVKEAVSLIKRKNKDTLIHCDAVQAFGKMPVIVKNLGVDMLTLSGHKFHAPKGIGAMYIRKGVNIRPLLAGGGQERGMRSGTESVPLIAGLGGALSDIPDFKSTLERLSDLRNYAKEQLLKIGNIKINSNDFSLPYILNISILGYRSETLLHFLEAKEIYVSSGSACSKGEVSKVLTLQGLKKAETDSALRISFSKYSSKEDADLLVGALKEAVSKLRRSVK